MLDFNDKDDRCTPNDATSHPLSASVYVYVSIYLAFSLSLSLALSLSRSWRGGEIHLIQRNALNARQPAFLRERWLSLSRSRSFSLSPGGGEVEPDLVALALSLSLSHALPSSDLVAGQRSLERSLRPAHLPLLLHDRLRTGLGTSGSRGVSRS